MYLATIAMTSVLATAPAPEPAPGGEPRSLATQQGVELSVLTYNVKGLPWPIALGRASALKDIGAELATMRLEGRQPDVVLIQEGFRAEIRDLVQASGYQYWARGPARSERRSGPPPEAGQSFRPVRYRTSGEGWGKFTGAGLHVLSDVPIVDVRSTAYRYCAGLDCLANKGAMLTRLALPGSPVEIDIVNTHLNSKRAAKVPRARSLHAHNLQTEELFAFIQANRATGTPLLVGGDFNVKNAPERYDHKAAARPYRVVSEFCHDPANVCEGEASTRQPWLAAQDLQAFGHDGPVSVQPIKVQTLFSAERPGPRLSDHDGYLVRYRLLWNSAAAPARRPVEVKPQFRTWGVKVSWSY
ncbi:endonuclease/exonuclease/phosphatase family protein [Phenylobacterium sp.]|uniref:endonuclease/exonuclease/phosphatase family protein n=1 Tax=Phenylobacterium sp. TaxID=1871053 RepID=UPI00286B2318|nr:endonuclease/exonuclease/phosphatase family protein [Phenylobacterium sp.]